MYRPNHLPDNLVSWTSASSGQGDQTELAESGRSDAGPHREIHGYATIADIMRRFTPFTGRLQGSAADEPAHPRDFCLMEGRHVTLHPVPWRHGHRGNTAVSSPTYCYG